MKKTLIMLLTVTFLITSIPTQPIVQAASADDYHTAAEFTITDEVTNADVEAFTFTAADGITGSSSPITNQMISGGGFEPIIFRTRFEVLQDNPNTIYAEESAISGYDVYMQGFLDGGEALIYRPENGELKIVRRSRIKNYNCSTKFSHFDNRAINGTSAKIGFDGWNANTDYYFAVATVDSNGGVSQPSEWVKITKKSNYNNKNGEGQNSYSSVQPDLSKSSSLSAPTNVQAGDDSTNNCATISWNAVNNASGYVVYRSYYPANEQKGFSIELTNHDVPLKKSDLVVVQKEFYDWSRRKYISPRVYDASDGQSAKAFAPTYNGQTVFSDDTDVSWVLKEHTNVPTQFNNPGKTYMEVDMGNSTKTVEFATYNHAGPNGNNGQPNDYYKILEYGHTYRIEFWAKAESETTIKAEVSFDQFYSKLGKKQFNITNEWQKYVAEYTIPEEVNDSPWIGRTILSFIGKGKVSVDAYQMYDTVAEPNMWFDRDIQAVKDSGFTTYRNHTFIKTFKETHSMDMLCNPSGAFNKSAAGSATLDSYLKVCKAAGVRPWFQIEMHMAPEEWLGWAEFMCATYDPDVDTPEEKPYAYKRYQAGQVKPWIEEFDKIIFEISNETWNSMFNPWNFSDTVDAVTGQKYTSSETYGMYHEYVLDLFRYSKYGKPLSEKMETVLGGWAVTKHGVQAGKYSQSATYITRAAYNGGWDEGTILSNDEQGYFFTSVYGIQKATYDAKQFVKDMGTTGDTRPIGTYEAGPGYPLPGGLSPEQQIEHNRQNQVQKSLAGAASTLDCFLLNAAYYGHDIQNYFTFSRGESYWTSHASIKDGGQEHLAFKALTMFNNSATGDFVNVTTNSAPTYDIPQVGNRPKTNDAPMVAAYATKNGNKYNVFVLSRKMNNYPFEGDDGYTPVTLNLPFANVDSVKVQKLVGDPKTTNISAENISIEEENLNIRNVNYSFTLDETTGAEAKGVGPCSIYLYTFEVSENQPATPIPSATPIPTEDPNKNNMVINPGFEDEEYGNHWVEKSQKYNQGWLDHDISEGICGFVSQSDDGTIRPVSGNKMFKILKAGGNNTDDCLTQNIDCKNGREYKLTFYTTNNSLEVFRVTYACVNNWEHSADCGNSDHNNKRYLSDNSNYVTKTDVGNGWYKVEGTFTCINDCGAKVSLTPSNDNTAVYYDDFKVEDTHPETIPTAKPTATVTPKPPYGEERPYPTPAPSLGATPKPTPTEKPDTTPNATPETSISPAPGETTTPGTDATPGTSGAPTVSESPTTTPDVTPEPAVKKVKKVKFVKKSVKVKKGKKTTLKVKLTPAKGLSKMAKKVKWSIDKKGKKVVKFVKKANKLNGKLKATIKAVKKGKAKVTCKAPSGKRAVCKITVK